METTIQSSFSSIRGKITLLEAIELVSLGFAFWCLDIVVSIGNQEVSFFDHLMFFIITQGILFGSWGIYNGFIRIARAGGKYLDIGIWWLATALTGTYTFWAWSILDVNRFILSKLFYRGDAPVEYAWNWRSKQTRKAWEQAHQAGYV